MKRIIFMLLCLITLCTAGYILIDYGTASVKQNESEEKVKQIAISAEEMKADTTDNEFESEKIKALQAENPDCIGWIGIPNTGISYPVMHTPDDPEFYLSHDFDKTDSKHGLPFLDFRCEIGEENQYIIYGHHKYDGTMFSALHNYMDESYFEEHSIFILETLKSIDEYEIIAVMKVPRNAIIYNMLDLESEDDYAGAAEYLKAGSLYDTGKELVKGDKLLILSTCEYSQSDGRLVVVGKTA